MDPLVPLSRLFSSLILTTNVETGRNILLIIILILLSAFFSATETAFSNCNKLRMRIKAEDGSKTAKSVMKVIDNYDKSLITILIGNNIVNNMMSSLATLVAIFILPNNDALASVLSTIIITILVFMFGETFPKNIAKANADRFCMVVCYPIRFLMIILYPLSIIFYGLTLLVKKLFGSKGNEPEITEDDLQNIVEAIEEEGVIDEGESDLIQSAIEFDSFVVKEILTPRKDIFAIDLRNDRDEIIKTLLSSNINFSRIPVYEGSLDNIVGILHLRKFLKEYMLNKDVDIESLLIEPYYVKSNINLDDMLDGFGKQKTHIALVINNNHRIIGMVTMDDVLEKLVGEQKHPKGSDASC